MTHTTTTTIAATRQARIRCVNPFFSRIDLRPQDYVWLILGSIFLAPLRLILSIIIFMLGSTLAKFYSFLLDTFFDQVEDPDTFHEWREFFKTHLVFVLNCIFFVCGFTKTTIVQRGDVTHEKDAPVYVFAPHTSLFDIAAGLAFNAPSSVAKSDIVNIPFFGNIFKLSNPVLVDRASRDSRQDVFKKVADAIKYSKIVFWPEGTCSNHKVLMQFKNGAFKFGYPVLPVAIRFEQFGTPDTLSWTWNGPGTVASLWYTFSRLRTHCEIMKLPVYYPSEEEKADPDLYAANVTKVFTKELGVPCLDYTFDDARFLKYHYFHSSSCVKFIKLAFKICSLRNSNQKPEPLFKSFLIDMLDKIRRNAPGYGVDTAVTPDSLLKILDCNDLSSELKESATLRDFLRVFHQVPDSLDSRQPRTNLHLLIVASLVDLTENDLWKRLENVVECITNHDYTMDEKIVTDILWLALNLEADDDDRAILEEYKTTNFSQLKIFLLEQFDFALRENANTLSTMADKTRAKL